MSEKMIDLDLSEVVNAVIGNDGAEVSFTHEIDTTQQLVQYILYKRFLIKEKNPNISLNELVNEICKDLKEEE